MHIYHVRTILYGVRRPSKLKYTCLISCSHTHPHTPTPFAPGASQDFSPLYTIYIHATPTIWVHWDHYIHHVHDPHPPPPPVAFFDLIATTELRDACTRLPEAVYHTIIH